MGWGRSQAEVGVTGGKERNEVGRQPKGWSQKISTCLLRWDYQLSKEQTVLGTALWVILCDIEQWARNRRMNCASEAVGSGEEVPKSTRLPYGSWLPWSTSSSKGSQGWRRSLLRYRSPRWLELPGARCYVLISWDIVLNVQSRWIMMKWQLVT